VKIRAARPEDLKAVGEVLSLNGQRVEPMLVAALERGVVGRSLRLDPQARAREVVRHHEATDAMDAFPGLSTLLVAEEEKVVVGAAQVLVPGQMLIEMSTRGFGLQVAASVAASIAKYSSLVVVDAARGRGIGAALTRRCVKIYLDADFAMIFGQFHESPMLERFYRRCGFDVLDAGQGVSLPPPVQWATMPEPGDRLIVRWHPRFEAWRPQAYEERRRSSS
jgi:GNAT superfamily N-acetyltransferase